MTNRKLALLSTLFALTIACGDDGAVNGGTDGSSGSGSSDTTAAATTLPPATTATTAGDASADGTSTGMADGSSGGTSGPATGSTGDATSGTDGSGSSGGDPGVAYPECMPKADPPCPEPYTMCWPPPMGGGGENFCTIECMDVGECPLPTSGTAVPVCEGPPGTDVCVLDCSMGDCPDGMDCIDVFGNGQFLRCSWP